MICNECLQDKPNFKTGVVNGDFISERCTDCFAKFEQYRNPNAAIYNLEREREDSARDIEQPWLPGGVPNPAFAHAYPKLAKMYFTPEQLKDL